MKDLIFYYIIGINIMAYLIMYIDKKRAIKNEWRIKESNLILVALIGGGIGSILGMYSFRHKTKHNKFKIGIPIIILAQISLLYFI